MEGTISKVFKLSKQRCLLTRPCMGMTAENEYCFQRQRALALNQSFSSFDVCSQKCRYWSFSAAPRANLRAKWVLFAITASSEEASLNLLYVCMQLKPRKQLISGASCHQSQKAKTQNMLYPFPPGFDLIRSGHLPGQKRLYLNADVSNPAPL